MTTTITVKTSFEGIHCYPEAPVEVAYLREPHRHIFGVCVEVEVFDDDREIEFIMLKHRIDEYIFKQCGGRSVWYMGRMSCEQVAKGIVRMLFESLSNPTNRYIAVTIDEDGENGATVSGYPRRSEIYDTL